MRTSSIFATSSDSPRCLGEWLTRKTECDIELRYTAIGERRAAQGVSLSHLMFAIVATKEHLWGCVPRKSWPTLDPWS